MDRKRDVNTALLSKELGDEAMTIAQQLEQRGMQQGMQQGKFENSREIAKNLLQLNELALEAIALVTQLRVDEVMTIKASLKPTKH